jgi:hypothetical protein
LIRHKSAQRDAHIAARGRVVVVAAMLSRTTGRTSTSSNSAYGQFYNGGVTLPRDAGVDDRGGGGGTYASRSAARVVPWFTPLAYVLGRSICAPLGPVIVTPASKDFRSGLFVVVAFAFGPPPGPPERRPPLSPFAPAAETAPGWLATINGFPVPDVVFVGFAEDFPAAAAFDRDDEDENPPPPPDCGPPWLGSSVRGVVP